MAKVKGYTDYPKLGQEILRVLKDWEKHASNSEFAAIWYGYDALQDEIPEPYTLNELKKAMKILRDEDKVLLSPIYDNDFKLCGRGWFLTETFK